MAGVILADYSGVHSKRTQPIVGFRTHFCKDPPTAGPSTTARHGKKTRSTPLGCRTTNTNGNGNRQCDNLLATLPLFESVQESSMKIREIDTAARYSIRNPADPERGRGFVATDNQMVTVDRLPSVATGF